MMNGEFYGVGKEIGHCLIKVGPGFCLEGTSKSMKTTG